MEQLEEGQCPGCGTTWVGHSGFGPTSGNFPSKNATSCPVHRAAPKLLEALKYYADPRAYVPCNPDDSQPLIVRKDGGKHARAAIEEAKK